MNDAQFLNVFEKGELNGFSHADHIRMAWLYLRRDGWEEGYANIQAGLKHFTLAHGVPEKYHETITRFWATLVHHAIEHQPDISDFTEFTETFPILLDKEAMLQHYSNEVLWSVSARQAWVEPDLVAMP